MKKKVLALVCVGTLICSSAFRVSADSVTAGDIVEEVDNDANEEDEENEGSKAGTSVTYNGAKPISPKTSDADATVVGLIAMMGMAGTVVCQKKLRS